jgi:hypothetical protein
LFNSSMSNKAQITKKKSRSNFRARKTYNRRNGGGPPKPKKTDHRSCLAVDTGLLPLPNDDETIISMVSEEALQLNVLKLSIVKKVSDFLKFPEGYLSYNYCMDFAPKLIRLWSSGKLPKTDYTTNDDGKFNSPMFKFCEELKATIDKLNKTKEIVLLSKRKHKRKEPLPFLSTPEELRLLH